MADCSGLTVRHYDRQVEIEDIARILRFWRGDSAYDYFMSLTDNEIMTKALAPDGYQFIFEHPIELKAGDYRFIIERESGKVRVFKVEVDVRIEAIAQSKAKREKQDSYGVPKEAVVVG